MSEPNPFVQEIVIRPYRVTAAYLMLMGLVVSAICLFDGAWENLGVVPLVAGAGLLALGILRFHPQSEFIRIDEHGVTIRKMFLEECYAWPEVRRFEAGWHRFVSSAVYIELDQKKPISILRSLAYLARNRSDILIVTWYFVDQFEMARKLNLWKASSLEDARVAVP